MKKKQFINTLAVGDYLECYFVITKAEKKQTKDGRAFWDIQLQDATGTIITKVWAPLSEQFKDIEEKTFVEVSGVVQEYGGKLQITAKTFRFLGENEVQSLAMAEFLPCSEQDPNDMFEELLQFCSCNFTYAPWLDFSKTFFLSESIKGVLLQSSAAKSMHHAYRGGLLEHMLSVGKLCALLSDYYPQLDKQLLVAGGLFHDIGKIVEMHTDISTEYTTEGLLLGHITQGIQLITPYMESAGVAHSLQVQLQHIILSHHGYEEFGSPKRPQTAEALIVHYADNIDAKLEMFRTLFKNVPEGTEEWSPRQWGFNNLSLFHPLPTAFFDSRERGCDGTKGLSGKVEQFSMLSSS